MRGMTPRWRSDVIPHPRSRGPAQVVSERIRLAGHRADGGRWSVCRVPRHVRLHSTSFFVRSPLVMQTHLWPPPSRRGATLALAPAIALAQQPTTITGRVTTEAGTALQGASVTIPA